MIQDRPAAEKPGGANAAQLSPGELRAVFGRNLRQLCDEGPSVSAICTAIGINRTQFNRYLSGEAFPRPDVLARICAHFGVDARILLEPLEALRSSSPPAPQMTLADPLLIGVTRPVDAAVLPDGVYRFWRRSFMFSDRMVSNLAQIRSRNGVTLFKAFEENLLAQQANPQAKRFPRLQIHGLVRQHIDGISIHCQDRQGQGNINFFEFGLEGNMRFYPGFSLLIRKRIDGMSRISAAVMERLPEDPAQWRQIVRDGTIHDLVTAPPIIRRALERIPPSL